MRSVNLNQDPCLHLLPYEKNLNITSCFNEDDAIPFSLLQSYCNVTMMLRMTVLELFLFSVLPLSLYSVWFERCWREVPERYSCWLRFFFHVNSSVIKLSHFTCFILFLFGIACMVLHKELGVLKLWYSRLSDEPYRSN